MTLHKYVGFLKFIGRFVSGLLSVALCQDEGIRRVPRMFEISNET